MFGKKKKVDVVVSTGKELDDAIKRKEAKIVVEGKLAKKMSWMAKLSVAKITALIGVLVALIPTVTTATVATGGVGFVPSVAAMTAAAAGTGIGPGTIAAICSLIATCSVSITLIIAVLKDYDIELSGDNKLILKSK